MAAVLVFGKEKIDVGTDQTIAAAMNLIDRFPDAYLFIRDGKPVPMTSTIENGDVIEAVRIASGG